MDRLAEVPSTRHPELEQVFLDLLTTETHHDLYVMRVIDVDGGIIRARLLNAPGMEPFGVEPLHGVHADPGDMALVASAGGRWFLVNTLGTGENESVGVPPHDHDDRYIQRPTIQTRVHTAQTIWSGTNLQHISGLDTPLEANATYIITGALVDIGSFTTAGFKFQINAPGITGGKVTISGPTANAIADEVQIGLNAIGPLALYTSTAKTRGASPFSGMIITGPATTLQFYILAVDGQTGWLYDNGAWLRAERVQ